MQLDSNEVHVWTADLAIPPEQVKVKFEFLNADERARAERFHFPMHSRRFIAARSDLRQILSLYLNIKPKDIVFEYTQHKKPYLHLPDHSRIQFNVSHSEDIAIYAVTLDHDIGIDIEKIKTSYDPKVANRYFSQRENEALTHLTPEERIVGFYRVWSRKEALVKAVGKGLSIPLSSFSVSVNDTVETILLENVSWSILPLSIQDGFQSALATNQKIDKISYLRFFEHGFKLDNVYHL